MGTSKSNSGPRNNTPLLPPWATEPPPSDNSDNLENSPNSDLGIEAIPKDAVIKNLRKARVTLSNFAKTGSERSFRRAAKAYVRSYGGARKAASTAIGGKATGARFAGFLSDVVNQGIRNTLATLGLSNYIGQPLDLVLSKIADAIAPNGSDNEDAAARKAVIDTLKFIYSNYDLESTAIEGLQSIDKPGMEMAVKEYVSSYIYDRWLQELGLKLEEKSISTRDLVKREKEAKRFIRATVDLDFSRYDVLSIDFKTGAGKELMDKIFTQAYVLIETL